MHEHLLEAQDISKRFGSVVALDQANLKVRRGEIHVLCGENGAGKSTLMNIISGVYPYGSYEGRFYFDGEECRFRTVRDSEAKGIAIIHQHFALISQLSIAENISLGNEVQRRGVIDWDATRAKALSLMAMVGLNENPDTLVRDITVAKQQLVEICKAISRDVKLLILDEPTSALNEEESENLLRLVVEFKKKGITSILISHKLQEMTKVCDAITILRDGKTIETLLRDEISIDRIIKGMVGRELTNLYPERKANIGDVFFEVKNWNVYDPTNPTKRVLKDINLNVRDGEVLGLAGLMGSGRTELAMSIFGRSYGVNISGSLIKDGKELILSDVPSAIANGLAYVPEDRHEHGVIQGKPVKDNMTLPSLDRFVERLGIDFDKEILVAQDYKEKLNIRARTIEQNIETLSGGNQQKVVFARWALSGADILILDEATRGIDVGAKYEIYQIINEMAVQGKAVVFISSDMPEILGMCDRVYVLSEGAVVGEFVGEAITQENIMKAIMSEGKEYHHGGGN